MHHILKNPLTLSFKRFLRRYQTWLKVFSTLCTDDERYLCTQLPIVSLLCHTTALYCILSNI